MNKNSKGEELIPEMPKILKKYKPCRDCGETMEYENDCKQICFECRSLHQAERARLKREKNKPIKNNWMKKFLDNGKI